MICLQCGNPMPRFDGALFTPLRCALVLDGEFSELSVLDAVHLGCVDGIEGQLCEFAGFVAVVISSPE
jgi:hypothetical protein